MTKDQGESFVLPSFVKKKPYFFTAAKAAIPIGKPNKSVGHFNLQEAMGLQDHYNFYKAISVSYPLWSFFLPSLNKIAVYG